MQKVIKKINVLVQLVNGIMELLREAVDSIGETEDMLFGRPKIR